MNPKRISWTEEDTQVAIRAIKRGQVAILSCMVRDDDTDAHKFFDREEGKAMDLYWAQEEFHAWNEACREDDEYYAGFENNYVPDMNDEYGF